MSLLDWYCFLAYVYICFEAPRNSWLNTMAWLFISEHEEFFLGKR